MPPSSSTTALARARKRARLEQEDLARLIGVSLRTYRRLETGQMTNPPLGYLVNCAIVLGVPFEELLDPAWLAWHNLDGGTPAPPTKR